MSDKVEQTDTVEGVVESEAISPVPPEPPTEEDINAYIFSQGLPKYKAAVSSLTSAELKRLATYLVSFPLETTKEEIDFRTEMGTATFGLGLQLMQAKFGLTLKALKDSMENTNNTQEENTDEQSKNE